MRCYGIHFVVFASLIIFAHASKKESKNRGTTPRLCGYKANEIPNFNIEPDLEPSFVEEFKNGFYFPLQSANNYNPGDLTKSQPHAKYSKTRNCYDVKIKAASLGSFHVASECQYIEKSPSITNQKCNIQGALGVDLVPIAAFGKFYATMTDNSTFIVGFTCVYNKDPVWFVMSITKTLSKDQLKEIVVHLESLGFDPNDAANEDTVLQAYKISKIDCGKLTNSIPVKTEDLELEDKLSVGAVGGLTG